MKISFLAEAEYELQDAIDYYSLEATGLGESFLNEILAALKRIADFPEAWHPLSENTRRCQTRKFPYGVIYTQLEPEHILVIAVSNLHRKPNHWQNRNPRL